MSAKEASVPNDGLTMAETADKHELYELSVQNVENEVVFLQDTFKQIRGREAHLMREDFCGTASACCQWVKQGEGYQAVQPPSTPSTCPVTCEAAFEARNKTELAISSGSPILPCGVRCAIAVISILPCF